MHPPNRFRHRAPEQHARQRLHRPPALGPRFPRTSPKHHIRQPPMAPMPQPRRNARKLNPPGPRPGQIVCPITPWLLRWINRGDRPETTHGTADRHRHSRQKYTKKCRRSSKQREGVLENTLLFATSNSRALPVQISGSRHADQRFSSSHSSVGSSPFSRSASMTSPVCHPSCQIMC